MTVNMNIAAYGSIVIQVYSDAFMEFTNSDKYHLFLFTFCKYSFYTWMTTIVITVMSMCKAALLYMTSEGFMKAVCVEYTYMVRFEGLQGEWGCAVMKCSECIEQYTYIKPYPAAFYFIAFVMPSPQIYQ